MIQVGQRYGMQTMEDSMRKLVESGVVDVSEVSAMMSKLSDGASASEASAGAKSAAASHAAPQAQAQPASTAAKSRSIF